jgi:photosystem II stability/assembly factor-like uncharacterized protein
MMRLQLGTGLSIRSTHAERKILEFASRELPMRAKRKWKASEFANAMREASVLMHEVRFSPSKASTEREGGFSVNRSFLFSSIVTILLLSAVELQAQWQQVNIGSAGKINAIASIGANVFAGTNAGIYRSPDSGASWTNVKSSFTLCLAGNVSKIFAGTSSGVIVSPDGGNSWAAPASGMSYYITALAVKDTNIFAGTYQNGVFRSTDNGASWTAVNNGLGAFQNQVTSLAVDGKLLFAGTAAGLCLSTDDGNSWSTLSAGNLSSLQFINCITASASTIFVGTPAGMLRSTDGDTTWEIINNGLNIGTSIFCITVDSSNLFLGTVYGVYRSSDIGGSWNAASSGLPTSPSQVYSLAASGSILFSGTNSGVFVSSDNGSSWAAANNGISGSRVSQSVLSGKGPDVFAVIDEGGVYTSLYISTDYGATWSANTGLESSFIETITVTDSAAFAATGDGIFESSDVGKTWHPINGGVMDTTYPVYLIQSGPNLIAATFQTWYTSSTQLKGLYLSSDGGASWQVAGTNLPPVLLTLAAIGPDGGVYVSTDHGVNWTIANDTLVGVADFASIAPDLFADRTQWTANPSDTFPSYQGGVFRSTDSGRTWTALTSGLPRNPLPGQLTVRGTDIFVNIWQDGFYFSRDDGNTWKEIAGSTNLSSLALSLFVNDSSIFVGTFGSGTWKLPLSTITSVKQPKAPAIPASFVLQQNYPNPFNPTTTIRYDIPERCHVLLDAYDVLGRKVETLVDAEKPPGHYQATFDASRFASGVYFYRLQVGSFTQVRKLIVVK